MFDVLVTGTPSSPGVMVGQRSLSETLPPYRVILHNDDINDMLYVVHALLASVPELAPQRAFEIMLEANYSGQAEVIQCPLERAELYRDRLQSHGLVATVERAVD